MRRNSAQIQLTSQAESWGQSPVERHVTEPNTGLNTLKLKTRAERRGDHYLVSGQKVWISTAREYHVERYLRESWIPRLAPVSPQLILCYIAEKVLGLPKSY